MVPNVKLTENGTEYHYPKGIGAPACLAKFDIQLTMCNTCCCSGGMTTSSVSSSLVIESDPDCRAWFSTFSDPIVRIYVSYKRAAKSLFSMASTCLDAQGCASSCCLWGCSFPFFFTGVQLHEDKEELSTVKGILEKAPVAEAVVAAWLHQGVSQLVQVIVEVRLHIVVCTQHCSALILFLK